MNFKLIIFLTFITSINAYNYILHVSDIHYDPKYLAKSPNNCVFDTKIGTGCCHKYDVPLKPYNSCSVWGDFQCDIPFLLLNNTFGWIQQHLSKPNFIFYTGDSVGHHDITQSVSQNIKTLNTVNNVMNSHFSDVPTYQVMGNHDTYPIDQTPDFIYDAILKNVSSYWAKWLDPPSRITARNNGYYALYIDKGIKLITINSIYYDSNNLFIVDTEAKENKTNHQWKWLQNQFQSSKNLKERVIVLNHIPIGSAEASSYYNQKLLELLSNYQDIIILQLYGHSHRDRFILYKYNNTFTGHGMITSNGMTSDHDPSFRMIVYNDDWQFLDYHQYSCGLNNIIKTNDFTCQNTYNFTTEYSVPDISLNSYLQLYSLMQHTSTIMNNYHYHYSPGANFGNCSNQPCINYYLSEIVVP